MIQFRSLLWPLTLMAPLTIAVAGEAPVTRALDPAVPTDTELFGTGAPQAGQAEAFVESSLAEALEQTSIPVAAPHAMTVYTYGEASSLSYVVVITAGGERHALFTHVDQFVGEDAVSGDGKHLFLSSNLRAEDGSWQQVRRLVRFEDKRRLRLPRLDCTERGGLWDGDRLITYGLTSDECCPAPGLSTPVCVWSTDGELLGRAEVHACWHAYASDAMESAMGLLPSARDVLWLYNGDCPSLADPDAPCLVHLQELTGQRRATRRELPGASTDGGCAPASDVTIEPGASTFDAPAFSATLRPTATEEP